MITALDSAALIAAGAIAGLVGSAGGITSLISYPALLAVGLPARPAAIANNVALVACWPGSAVASRPELHGKAGWLRRWTLLTAVGGATGAALLIRTPATAFQQLVPFLVAGGSFALLFEPRLTAWRRRRRHRPRPTALPAGLFIMALYNGYFGAGSGVLTLTLLLLLVDQHLPTANALKNMLIGAGSIASATLFALAASVDWRAAVPLAIGMLCGSSLGPRLTRRLPVQPLRVMIALLGIALAIQLFADPNL